MAHKTGARAVLLALCALLVIGVGSAQATPGALDPGFGIAGAETVQMEGANSSLADALVLQPDGKLVAAGYSQIGSKDDFALVRLNPSGSLDTGFGTNGGTIFTLVGPSNDAATSLALQPDGKITAAGYSYNGTNDDFALVRYNADGSLDTGFGTGGKVTTDILGSDDEASALALQSDGKLVAAGQTFNGSDDDFALVRYNGNGSLDTSFGAGGGAITPIGPGDDAPDALALQPDGKIIAAGYSYNGTNDDFALVRYNANGFPDSNFGTNGRETTDISANDFASAVAVQPDGKIVLAGTSGPTGARDFAVVRYNTNGSLDTGFGTGGKVTISLGPFNDTASGIALQPDGKILVAGYSATASGGSDFAVARLNADGSLDSGFGSGGKALSTALDGDATAVALQPDGKIVAAGWAAIGSTAGFAFARFLGNTLAVKKSGSGEGTVSSSPAGIACGSTCLAPFAAVPVTLTATPQAGSVFSGWSGAGCSGTSSCHIQLSSDEQVTATFALVKTLTVTKAGSGAGTVSSSPTGIACGSSCTHSFPAGTSITLAAKASPGSVFSGWSGACSGTGSCHVQMGADHDVTATFSTLCFVPKVKGETLAAAKHAIKRANCSVGRVTKSFSAKVKKGHVISQKPKPGTQLQARSKVSLKVSTGRRR